MEPVGSPAFFLLSVLCASARGFRPSMDGWTDNNTLLRQYLRPSIVIRPEVHQALANFAKRNDPEASAPGAQNAS